MLNTKIAIRVSSRFDNVMCLKISDNGIPPTKDNLPLVIHTPKDLLILLESFGCKCVTINFDKENNSVDVIRCTEFDNKNGVVGYRCDTPYVNYEIKGETLTKLLDDGFLMLRDSKYYLTNMYRDLVLAANATFSLLNNLLNKAMLAEIDRHTKDCLAEVVRNRMNTENYPTKLNRTKCCTYTELMDSTTWWNTLSEEEKNAVYNKMCDENFT